MSAAILNGYPLVYHDSGVYLLTSNTLYAPIDRPAFYGLFLRLTRVIYNSNWIPIWTQSLIFAFLIRDVLRQVCHKQMTFRSYWVVGFVLAVGSSLPWISGQIMPDAWASILALSLFLYLFSPLPPYSPVRALYLFLMFISSLVHFSHFAIFATLLFLATLIQIFQKEFETQFLRRAALVWLAVIPVTFVTNGILSSEGYFSKTGHVFIINRLVRDGIVQTLLEQRCSLTSYALCSHLQTLRELKTDEYLWSPKSPLHSIGGWEKSSDESWRVITDSLRFLPGMHFQKAFAAWKDQLVSAKTGNGLYAYKETDPVHQFIARFHPNEYEDLSNSRQQKGLLEQDLAKVNPIHQSVAWISLGIMLLFLITRSSNENRKLIRFCIYVLSFVLINAAICGILSGPSDRYQSRTLWMMALAAALVILQEFFFNYKEVRKLLAV